MMQWQQQVIDDLEKLEQQHRREFRDQSLANPHDRLLQQAVIVEKINNARLILENLFEELDNETL